MIKRLAVAALMLAVTVPCYGAKIFSFFHSDWFVIELPGQVVATRNWERYPVGTKVQVEFAIKRGSVASTNKLIVELKRKDKRTLHLDVYDTGMKTHEDVAVALHEHFGRGGDVASNQPKEQGKQSLKVGARQVPCTIWAHEETEIVPGDPATTVFMERTIKEWKTSSLKVNGGVLKREVEMRAMRSKTVEQTATRTETVIDLPHKVRGFDVYTMRTQIAGLKTDRLICDQVPPGFLQADSQWSLAGVPSSSTIKVSKL